MKLMEKIQALTGIGEVHLLWLGPNGGNTEHQQWCKAQQDTGSINRHHFNTCLQEGKPGQNNAHREERKVFCNCNHMISKACVQNII